MLDDQIRPLSPAARLFLHNAAGPLSSIYPSGTVERRRRSASLVLQQIITTQSRGQPTVPSRSHARALSLSSMTPKMQLRAGLGGHESPVLLPSPGPSASPIKRQPHDDDSMEHESQEPAGRPKRRRIGYACDLCRLKKNRCDGDRPACGPCRGRRQECIYSPQRTRVSVTQEYVHLRTMPMGQFAPSHE